MRQEAAKGNPQGHRCHAEGCSTDVPPAMFMCKRHWFMVPINLRNQIWALYEPGQEITKSPNNLYVKVALAAIKAVAEKEAKYRG